MMLKHLILNTSWRAILEAIVRIYPDQAGELEQFKKVYTQLYTMPVRPSNMCIHMEWDKDHSPEPMDYLKVYAMERSEAGTDAGQRYWIDYERWGAWLGMDVAEDTRNVFDDADIVAACLWEMTFHGYEEACMLCAYEELVRKNEEFDRMSKAERAERFTKIGEVKGYTIIVANDVLDKLT